MLIFLAWLFIFDFLIYKLNPNPLLKMYGISYNLKYKYNNC